MIATKTEGSVGWTVWCLELQAKNHTECRYLVGVAVAAANWRSLNYMQFKETDPASGGSMQGKKRQ